MKLMNIDRPILCVFRIRDSNWNKIVHFFNEPSITSFKLHDDDWTISKEEMKTYALLVARISEDCLEFKCPWSGSYQSIFRNDINFKLYDVDCQIFSTVSHSHSGANIMLL